ncbi:hypothetical protein [Planctomycetes bacterium TBK1r]|uniref:Uncharacterized protein n=1 Tax=Stieleria magnilauensis TaxID=2527963 RepID=A0ABX5XGY3_9BACT|nr:hypothetical protein TBK1r_01620 [Planctomycetes bacterium TBK1r]
MTPERLYELINAYADEAELPLEERALRLAIADRMNDIGTDDLHDLTYGLAADGLLDDASLNAFLIHADAIVDEKIERS